MVPYEGFPSTLSVKTTKKSPCWHNTPHGGKGRQEVTSCRCLVPSIGYHSPRHTAANTENEMHTASWPNSRFSSWLLTLCQHKSIPILPPWCHRNCLSKAHLLTHVPSDLQLMTKRQEIWSPRLQLIIAPFQQGDGDLLPDYQSSEISGTLSLGLPPW